jgi:hypothetical protein
MILKRRDEEIIAIKYNGKNKNEIFMFVGKNLAQVQDFDDDGDDDAITLDTLRGRDYLGAGDWVVKTKLDFKVFVEIRTEAQLIEQFYFEEGTI